jgi:coiled-coil domain-containing protein 12
MSSHEKLSAAANDRKARLAQLKSLKRKQAPDSEDTPDASALEDGPADTSTALTTTDSSVTKSYLSGRNFDAETRNVKLGFESTPVADPTKTLEYKAEQLAQQSKQEQDAEKAEDKPLDLFKLQPKKPNWDLKRDLGDKTKALDVQTENSIARLVKERVEGQKRVGSAQEDGEKQAVGMEGREFVEAMHLKEKEEEEERKREAEDEDVS